MDHLSASLQLGYNTNGLANHSLVDAIELLSGIGFQGVAITLDHGALNPFDRQHTEQLEQVRALLVQHRMISVVETGARFLLDPKAKHEPTLVSPDRTQRSRRIEFLLRAIDIAVALGSDCVSLWSGVVRDGAGDREAILRLVDALQPVLVHAERRGMPLAFEPEPGMLVDTLARYGDLLSQLHESKLETDPLRLTIDVGHLHCLGEVPIAEQIRRWANRLANVHMEDMRFGQHEHLMFGEGEIDFAPVIAALAEIRYAGLVGVELSRHSHVGPAAAQQSYDFLQTLFG